MNIRSRSPEPPYCWQNKDILRHIESAFDSESATRFMTSCYFGLTRIASNEASESFSVSMAAIARITHVSLRSARKAIQMLEMVGVISVERRKVEASHLNDKSIYTLLDSSKLKILGAPFAARQNMDDKLCTHSEVKEKKKENTPKALHGFSGKSRLLPISELSDDDLHFVELYNRFASEHPGFMKVTGITDGLEKALEVIAPSYDDEGFIELLTQEAYDLSLELKTDPSANRTFVRCCWNNY